MLQAWAVVSAALLGCATDVSQTKRVSQMEQATQSTVIFSGSPNYDAKAFSKSETLLSAGAWNQLEKLTPRPIWEKQNGQRDTRIASPLRPPLAYPATTQPATTQPVMDESTLPVTIVELPDGKLRIIWKLVSYGGSNVTSATDGGTSRRKITVTAADLTPLVAALTQQIGATGSVTPLPSENTLVITCEKAARDSILNLMWNIDKPTRQVEIAVKIFEVSHDFDFQQGARLLLNRIASDGTQSAMSTFDTARLLESVTKGPYQGSVVQLMKTFESAGINLDASFQLLAESGMIHVVSAPRMTVGEGRTGYMLAGQELPIESSTYVGTTAMTTTTYKPVGVQLYITPQVISADQIKLHVISIVSAVAGFAPMQGLQGGPQTRDALFNPIIESREAETAVTVGDRNTLVISGLRMVRTTARENKVPLLGDIPGLGWLFKNHRSQQQASDLYFFLTPRLPELASVE